jgi:uncharacterized repeat protein (TIGR02543 family)
MENQKPTSKTKLGMILSITALALAFIAFVVTLLGPVAAPGSVVVAFDTAGGTPVNMVTLPGAGKLSSIPTTSREGSSFEHWLKGNEVVTLNTVFTSNTTVRANFTPITFTVRYEVDGGQPINTEEVEYGASLRLPTPVKADAIFQGWFTNEGLTQAVEEDVIDEVLQDYVFYAKWSTIGEDLFSVSFFSEGLGLIETRVVEPNTVITLPAAPVRENYAFLNWVEGIGFTDVATNTYTITQDMVFFAKWEATAGLVTITFDTQGGTPVAPIQVPYGSYWQDPEEEPFLADGYQFLSWITNCNFDGFEISCTTLDETYVVEDNMTVLAQYDYMIPLSTMRFETYVEDNRIIGYTLANIDYFTEDTISTLILPARFSGLPVVALGEGVFDGFDFIDNVIIPENYLYILSDAFYESSIKEVFLPNSLERISSSAFSYSTLEMVHFDNDSHLDFIGSSAFRNTQLTSFAVPETVNYIGQSAFEDTPLETVVFSGLSQINYISDDVFRNTQLVNVTLPESLYYLGDDAFAQTATLTTVHLPASLRELGRRVFEETGLTTLTFGNQSQLKVAGDDLFGNKNDGNLAPIITNNSNELVIVGPILAAYQGDANDELALAIPEGVRVILNNLNHDDANFVKASVTLPSTLQSVGRNAFQNATIKSDLVIPKLYEIFDYAFYNVAIEGDLTLNGFNILGYESFSNSNAEHILFKTPTSFVEIESYAFRESSALSLTMEEGYVEIPFGFTLNSQITSMTFPNSIHTINGYGLDSSTLTTLTINGDDPLLRVDSNVFTGSGMSSPWYIAQGNYVILKNLLYKFVAGNLAVPYDIVIPDGVKQINSYAFSDYVFQTFNSFDLNDVEMMFGNVFQQWPRTFTINTPLDISQLEAIGAYQFNNNTNNWNLNTITYNNNLRFNPDLYFYYEEGLNLDSYYFSNMASFNDEGFKIMGNLLIQYDKTFDTTPNSVVIPEQIEIIGLNAFYMQELGGPLTLSSQTKWIQQNAFYETKFVGNITLPNQLKYIGGYAFYNTNLTEITLPASLRNVEYGAFETATLQDATIENPDQLQINNEAFGYFNSNRNDLFPIYKNNFVNNAVIIDGVFFKYFGYQEQYTMPEGIRNITSRAFSYRQETMRGISLPSTVKYIASEAFESLELLSTVDFSKVVALNYIGYRILGATRVKNVVIAAPVTNIHPEAFVSMSHLSQLNVNMVNPVFFVTSLNYDLYD